MATVPGLMGTQEAIRQAQSKDKREEHRARRCNFVAHCIKTSSRAREINDRPLVLRDGQVFIDGGTLDEDCLVLACGYYLPYPESPFEGMVTKTSMHLPIMNWMYIDAATHQLRYGIRKDADGNITGPFDCTAHARRVTLFKWEGWCAVEEQPGQWAVYFDVNDNGLMGKIPPNSRILEIELERREERYKKESRGLAPGAPVNSKTMTSQQKMSAADQKALVPQPPPQAPIPAPQLSPLIPRISTPPPQPPTSPTLQGKTSPPLVSPPLVQVKTPAQISIPSPQLSLPTPEPSPIQEEVPLYKEPSLLQPSEVPVVYRKSSPLEHIMPIIRQEPPLNDHPVHKRASSPVPPTKSSSRPLPEIPVEESSPKKPSHPLPELPSPKKWLSPQHQASSPNWQAYPQLEPTVYQTPSPSQPEASHYKTTSRPLPEIPVSRVPSTKQPDAIVTQKRTFALPQALHVEEMGSSSKHRARESSRHHKDPSRHREGESSRHHKSSSRHPGESSKRHRDSSRHPEGGESSKHSEREHHLRHTKHRLTKSNSTSTSSSGSTGYKTYSSTQSAPLPSRTASQRLKPFPSLPDARPKPIPSRYNIEEPHQASAPRARADSATSHNSRSLRPRFRSLDLPRGDQRPRGASADSACYPQMSTDQRTSTESVARRALHLFTDAACFDAASETSEVEPRPKRKKTMRQRASKAFGKVKESMTKGNDRGALLG